MLKIKRVTSETMERKGMKILLYGIQGIGKTTLAATAQDSQQMRDVIFLDIEGGTMSIAHRGDIDSISISSTEELAEIQLQLKERHATKNQFSKYNTVVVDSVSDLQSLNLEEISASRSKSGRGSADLVSQEDYQRSTRQLVRLFRSYRDLDMNVIFTALQRDFKSQDNDQTGEKGKITEIAPSLTPALVNALMAFVDFVWCLETDEDKKTKEVFRTLITTNYGLYRAKSRGKLFPEKMGAVVTNPSLPALYDMFIECETKQAQKE